MRELGIIPEETNARALADYLLTRDITTKVVANRDGRFGVWVQSEDRMGEARQVLGEFLQNPDDTRFQAATRSAREIRKRTEEIEAEHRKRSHNLRDRWDGPLYRRAPLTFALIAASIAVFVGDKFDPALFARLMFSVRLVTEDGFVVDLGLANIKAGEVWRLITPIFIHLSVYHILFNMLAMAAFGQRIEMTKGWVKFLILVLVSALLSNIGQFVVAGGGFGGMSGVVFALAGYLWIKGHVSPDEGLGLDNQNAQLMFGWFLLGIFAPVLFPGQQGFPFNMANMAHGVGLLAGLVFGLLRF